jgi:hypothetical protein
MPLKQLIYFSKISDINMEQDIGKILESCVSHNKENGITGMLLYATGTFLQVLEGEKQAVDETMSRVFADPRHYDVKVLIQEPIEERHFSQWSMGYQRLGEDYLRDFPEYAHFFQLRANDEAIRAKPGVALELLLLFSHK